MGSSRRMKSKEKKHEGLEGNKEAISELGLVESCFSHHFVLCQSPKRERKGKKRENSIDGIRNTPRPKHALFLMNVVEYATRTLRLCYTTKGKSTSPHPREGVQKDTKSVVCTYRPFK